MDSNSARVKKVGGRRWWLLGSGLVIAGLGITGFIIYALTMNMGIGAPSVFMLVGGCVAAYYGYQPRDEGIVLTASGKNIKPIEANAFNIYRDRLVFEKMDDSTLLGQPRKCRNDNKYYYVHTTGDAWRGKDSDANKLIAFTLPDTQYRNPTEFANNLNIPAHRELAKKRSTLFQKLSPALILVGMMIVFILWVATSPPPAATAAVPTYQTTDHPVQAGSK
jgi:hypothetical protein